MTTPLTALLDELEALAKSATPGPWSIDETETYYDGKRHPAAYVKGPTYAHSYEDTVPCVADAAFIAALNPERALQLVAVVRAAQEVQDARSLMFDQPNPTAPGDGAKALLLAQAKLTMALKDLAGVGE